MVKILSVISDYNDCVVVDSVGDVVVVVVYVVVVVVVLLVVADHIIFSCHH